MQNKLHACMTSLFTVRRGYITRKFLHFLDALFTNKDITVVGHFQKH